ncbi:hypothetical protein I6I99_21110 [Sphingobacterium multivorum]|nr:hypothetical protein [Sphingobacterium multivorum]QQT29816.1 hypothetical protein I6I99_21110 [Sphingobacterium multivorum]
MELLENEKELITVQVNQEKFKVTDKRILYKNGAQEAFIGLNELRGADIRDEEVNQYTYTYNPTTIVVIVAVIACLCVFLYPVFTTNMDIEAALLAGAFFGVFGGIIISCIIGGIAGLIAWYIKESTATKVKMVNFTITQKDGQFWYDGVRSQDQRQALNKLKEHINSYIYQ